MFPTEINPQAERQRLGAVSVPAPRGFRPLYGPPREVRMVKNSWRIGRGNTAARAQGLRYEAKVQKALEDLLPLYLAQPAFGFSDDLGARVVIPDGLLSNPERVWIFEIKNQHSPEAWWQLEQLYRPVLQARRPQCPITCVEICRSYDPAMPFPADFTVFDSVGALLSSTVSLGVLPWRL